MMTKNTILLYGRSTLNIIISIVTVLLIVVATLFLHGFLKALVSLGIFLVYIVVTLVILLSKKGAREILEEYEENRGHTIDKVMTQYREIRDRIAFLRIGDKDISKALDYFLLVSGNYLNKCSELETYSPEANRNVEEVLEVCQLYLEEYDETLTEKHFNVEDTDPFTGYKERTIKAILQGAENIKMKMKKDFTTVTREEQLEIIEEMNKEDI
jgi:Ca2+/Na+ antiporter